MTATTRLGPEQRRAALRSLASERFDVVVVGGGVVGAGCALDAASRGLRVACVERHDWAAGTSSRSSRLIHGGLRYLERGHVHLVREALRERALLLTRLAPHLVRPVTFLVPLRRPVVERAYLGAGMLLYDRLGGARALPGHRHLGRDEVLAHSPHLRCDGLAGGILYHDAQVDDARHTLSVARTAAGLGAVMATRVKASGAHREAGRVAGVNAVDTESGETLTVRGRVVVTAAGVWTGELLARTGAPTALTVRPTKGVHLVVPRERLGLGAGLLLRTESSVLFVIPWEASWLVGTTDTDWSQDLERPVATSTDVAYLLARLNARLRHPLGVDDVTDVYAGLRPLVDSRGIAGASRVSREHAVVSPEPNLVAVAGGKYTTYRVMARDAVDAAARHLGVGTRSRTDAIPLHGATGASAARRRATAMVAQGRLDAPAAERLVDRHGGAALEVLDIVDSEPELAAPLLPSLPVLGAEAVHAVLDEGAIHLDDIVQRRLRLWSTDAAHVATTAEAVAGCVASHLGWTAPDLEREVEAARRRHRAARAAAALADDASATAAAARADGEIVAASSR